MENDDNAGTGATDKTAWGYTREGYAYEPKDILNILEKCGFEILCTYDDYSDNPTNNETERIVVVAKKIKTIFKDELK